MAEVLIAGKQDEVKKLTQEALNIGAEAKELLDKGLLAGMNVVGKRYKAGDMFIPEVLLCALHARSHGYFRAPAVGIRCGRGRHLCDRHRGGDLHDIGKNLVSLMLQGAGSKVLDLGTNITAAQFVEAVKQRRP